MTIAWIWTVTHGLGLVVWGLLIGQAYRTLSYSNRHSLGNGDRRRLLHEHIRSGIGFWVVHAVFFYVGLRFLIGFNFGAVPYLFIAAGLIMLLVALWKFRDRTLLGRPSR